MSEHRRTTVSTISCAKNDGYCYYTASKRAVRCIAYLLFWSIKSAGQQMSCIFLQPDDGVRFSFVETAPVPAVPVFSVLYRKRQLPRAVFSSSSPAAIPCPRARCSIGRPTAPPQKIQCCCCWRDNADDDDDRTKMQTAVSVALRCAHMNAPATERTHTRTRHDHAIDHQWA